MPAVGAVTVHLSRGGQGLEFYLGWDSWRGALGKEFELYEDHQASGKWVDITNLPV